MVGGVLKCRSQESEQFCIGDLLICTSLVPTHPSYKHTVVRNSSMSIVYSRLQWNPPEFDSIYAADSIVKFSSLLSRRKYPVLKSLKIFTCNLVLL